MRRSKRPATESLTDQNPLCWADVFFTMKLPLAGTIAAFSIIHRYGDVKVRFAVFQEIDLDLVSSRIEDNFIGHVSITKISPQLRRRLSLPDFRFDG